MKSDTRQSDSEPILQTVAEPLQKVLQEAIAAAGKPPAPQQATKTVYFRPLNRQPLATLTILDDGNQESGETIRIRDARLVIGRTKGDVTIPFDSDMSAEHAELRCQRQKGKYRWYLIDMGSTNGTFLRAYRASLSREMELMMGSRRYFFQLPAGGDEGQETQVVQTQTYRAPSHTMIEQLVPRLVEAGTTADQARTFSLAAREAEFGRDASCRIAIESDPFLSPKHARFYQDERGRWMVEDKKSHNGIWIRVKRMPLDQRAEFQLGQQRFRFEPRRS